MGPKLSLFGWTWIIMVAGWLVVGGTFTAISVRRDMALGIHATIARLKDRAHAILDALPYEPNASLWSSAVADWVPMANPNGGTVNVRYALISLDGHLLRATPGGSGAVVLPGVWRHIAQSRQGAGVALTPRWHQTSLVVWQRGRRDILVAAVNYAHIRNQVFGVIERQNGVTAALLLIVAMAAALWTAHVMRRVFHPLLEIQGVQEARRLSERTPVKEVAAIAAGWGIAMQRQQAAQQQLRWIADHDPLTGLLNRRGFLALLSQYQRQRDAPPAMVLIADLDHFKAINDTYGHSAGDHVLKEVARRLGDGLQAPGQAARLGGDEFALLVPLAREDRDARRDRAALNVLTAVAGEVRTEHWSEHITLSAGSAVWPADGEDLTELLHDADLALYAAKKAGGSQHQAFSAALNEGYRKKHHVRQQLQKALEQGEIVLYYQPVVDLATGKLTGAEALVRWQDPDRGLVPPGEFLPLIEDQDLFRRLQEVVIQGAIAQAAHWWHSGLTIRVSVNVPPFQFLDPGLPDEVKSLMARYRLPAGGLEIEVTESAELGSLAMARHRIQMLSHLGAQVAVDDFGTGYASLAYLLHLPVQHIKVDQSFIRQLEPGSDEWWVVGGVLALCRFLGRHVVAEGVESARQVEILRIMGAEEAQGYVIAPPMPADAFEQWARAVTEGSQMTLPVSPQGLVHNGIIILEYQVTQWAQQVVLAAEHGEASPGQMRLADDSACACGQWLNQLQGHSGYPPHVADGLQNAHTRVHQWANRLLDGSDRSMRELEEFEGALEEFLARIQSLMHSWTQEVPRSRIFGSFGTAQERR